MSTAKRTLTSGHATLGEQLFDLAIGQAFRRCYRTASEITSGGNRKVRTPATNSHQSQRKSAATRSSNER